MLSTRVLLKLKSNLFKKFYPSIIIVTLVSVQWPHLIAQIKNISLISVSRIRQSWIRLFVIATLISRQDLPCSVTVKNH